MEVTKQQLQAIMPNAGSKAELYLPVLNQYAEEFGISTKLVMAHFLAQIAHESGELRRTEENLNYSAEGLMKVFPSHFTAQSAKAYAHHPEKIGNRVYAKRMGNGSETSGDGYLYRGRGLIMVTGKNNYKAYGEYLQSKGMDVDLLKEPQLLTGNPGSMKSAMWIFKTSGCIRLAEADNLKGVTLKINGGLNGLASRAAYLARAKKALG